MQHVSAYAFAALVCLSCSGMLLAIPVSISGNEWKVILVALCWPTAVVSLALGTVFGVLGFIAEKGWRFRLQAGISGLLCVGSLCWFWQSLWRNWMPS